MRILVGALMALLLTGCGDQSSDEPSPVFFDAEVGSQKERVQQIADSRCEVFGDIDPTVLDDLARDAVRLIENKLDLARIGLEIEKPGVFADFLVEVNVVQCLDVERPFEEWTAGVSAPLDAIGSISSTNPVEGCQIVILAVDGPGPVYSLPAEVIAHEVGHCVVHYLRAELGIPATGEAKGIPWFREGFAHYFATRFMPDVVDPQSSPLIAKAIDDWADSAAFPSLFEMTGSLSYRAVGFLHDALIGRSDLLLGLKDYLRTKEPLLPGDASQAGIQTRSLELLGSTRIEILGLASQIGAEGATVLDHAGFGGAAEWPTRAERGLGSGSTGEYHPGAGERPCGAYLVDFPDTEFRWDEWPASSSPQQIPAGGIACLSVDPRPVGTVWGIRVDAPHAVGRFALPGKQFSTTGASPGQTFNWLGGSGGPAGAIAGPDLIFCQGVSQEDCACQPGESLRLGYLKPVHWEGGEEGPSAHAVLGGRSGAATEAGVAIVAGTMSEWRAVACEPNPLYYEAFGRSEADACSPDLVDAEQCDVPYEEIPFSERGAIGRLTRVTSGPSYRFTYAVKASTAGLADPKTTGIGFFQHARFSPALEHSRIEVRYDLCDLQLTGGGSTEITLMVQGVDLQFDFHVVVQGQAFGGEKEMSKYVAVNGQQTTDTGCSGSPVLLIDKDATDVRAILSVSGTTRPFGQDDDGEDEASGSFSLRFIP